MDNQSFCDLFYKALDLHRNEFLVDDNAINRAITVLQNEYGPKPWKLNSTCCPVNYNDPAFRCAYLHKYASCHAALVQNVLQKMFLDNATLRSSFLGCEPINICCLGGGPGTDIVSLSSVFCLLDEYRKSSFHFTVVDCMVQWAYALLSVTRAAVSGQFQCSQLFDVTWRYLEADMLSRIPKPVIEAIKSADMVTMVKFVSAAASEVTPNMIKVVFSLLKPHALVLFIDNAAGGFYETVSEAAFTCGLSTECGPFRHMKFENEIFKRKMFGFYSLSSTTVAAQMWRKNASVFWNLYETHSTPTSSSVRLPKKQRRAKRQAARDPKNNLHTSKQELRTDKLMAVSNDACFVSSTLNERFQAINDHMRRSVDASSLVVKGSCTTATGLPAKISLPCSYSNPIATSIESKRTSKTKRPASERELSYSMNKDLSTRKEKSQTIEKHPKTEKHADIYATCSNMIGQNSRGRVQTSHSLSVEQQVKGGVDEKHQSLLRKVNHHETHKCDSGCQHISPRGISKKKNVRSDVQTQTERVSGPEETHHVQETTYPITPEEEESCCCCVIC